MPPILHAAIRFSIRVALAFAAFLCHMTARAEASASTRLVFAHYMVCCPRDGLTATVEDFRREIELARTFGIDGFALNMPGWSLEPHYGDISRRLFRAAESLSPPFKLFVSFDDAPVSDSEAILKELSHSPAYLRVDQKLVVSTYGGTPEWGKALADRLNTTGLKMFFVPNYQKLSVSFWSKVHAYPTAYFLDQLYSRHSEIDGYFAFGPDLGYLKPPSSSSVVVESGRSRAKLSMIGISPYYRGLRTNFRVLESGGFAGMAAQWQAAIDTSSDWIEIVTWNDWGESTYVAPFGDIRQQNLWNYHWGPLLNHDAYLKASHYFLDWFKTGQKPEILQPRIFYFYRPHQKSAYGISSPDTGEPGRPKGWEDLVDGIFVSAFLPSSATVTIAGDTSRQSIDFPAGVSHHRFEVLEGELNIEYQDQGGRSARKRMEFPITRLGQIGNFNYFSGELQLQ